MTKHFIVGDEFGTEFVKKVISDAILFKSDSKNIPNHQDKSALFLFFNESLRTRMSFLFGAQKMKINSMCENVSNMYKFETQNIPMNSDKPEHIKEAAKVLSRYADIIGIRNSCFIGGKGGNDVNIDALINDDFINTFVSYATSSIINMESDAYHPMQGLADIMTISEKFNKKDIDLSDKNVVVTYAPHIKHLPIATPQSQILSPAILSANVTLTCPVGFDLSSSCIKKVQKYAKSFKIEYDQNKALENADVVIAKSWLSLENLKNNNLENSDEYYNKHKSWMLTQEKMKLTNNAIFMHCLPVRRDIEVASEVLDFKNSAIIDQAENRMWAQMALMHNLINL